MNFDINVLTSYQEQRFTASQITAYGLPIKQLIKAKQTELYIPEHRDNNSDDFFKKFVSESEVNCR